MSPLDFLAMWVSGGATECEWRAPQWRPGDLDSAGGHPGPGIAAIAISSHIAISSSHTCWVRYFLICPSCIWEIKLVKPLCNDCILHLIQHWGMQWLITGRYLSSNTLYCRSSHSLDSKYRLIYTLSFTINWEPTCTETNTVLFLW